MPTRPTNNGAVPMRKLIGWLQHYAQPINLVAATCTVAAALLQIGGFVVTYLPWVFYAAVAGLIVMNFVMQLHIANLKKAIDKDKKAILAVMAATIPYVVYTDQSPTAQIGSVVERLRDIDAPPEDVDRMLELLDLNSRQGN